ncbi:hypothetical protein, partial [Pedobacter xixiisoli]
GSHYYRKGKKGAMQRPQGRNSSVMYIYYYIQGAHQANCYIAPMATPALSGTRSGLSTTGFASVKIKPMEMETIKGRIIQTFI